MYVVPAKCQSLCILFSSMEKGMHQTDGRLCDSFQHGGAALGELDITFARLFNTAIIELEYVFAIITAATW